MKLKILAVVLLCLSFNSKAGDKKFALHSPDKKLSINIITGDSTTYEVAYKGLKVLLPSSISMNLGNIALGRNVVVDKAGSHHSKAFNELELRVKAGYKMVFRVYNEGMAYRFITNISDSIRVISEEAEFNLVKAPAAYLQETDNYTSWEGPYVKYTSTEMIERGKRATTPALFSYQDSGVEVAIAESDLFDYPGMYIEKGVNGAYTGNWAKYPTKTELGSWGNFVSVVKDRADFLSQTTGKRTFPWRVVMVSEDDRDLLTNHLVRKLASPSRLKDISWIKPGKATWEWWHDALLPGANIPSGMPNRNTALYNYYVDFAAANKLEYLMIDAGWSDNYNLKKINPKNDVRAVIARAREKGVGVFLWCVGTTLLKDLDDNLDFLASIGAVGIKVDFFDRDDQLAMQWIERIAKEAAKRKLMVNFHGCSKPTGMEITYPNIVNYEAVRGAESHKWDCSINPDHHLLMPFIRMLAGPMDYTPGAMRNKTKAHFKPIDPGLPSGQGTRSHELAMFVLYDQPFAMLADSPTEYEKYPDIMKFLSAVPTVYDESKALKAKIGEYAMVARRKGSDWYLGAMTNWEPKEMEVDFGFLERGVNYTADIYFDAAKAAEDAEQYVHQVKEVNSTTKMNVKMAPGGGFAIMMKKSIFKK